MSNEEQANSIQQPSIEGDDFTAIITKIKNEGVAIFFTYIEDETSTVEASITDNWVETNHTIQDHIAVKPRIYRLRGCVGEVTYVGSTNWLEKINQRINQNPVLQKTINALKPIAAISGVVSNATSSAIAIVNQLEASYNRYKKMIEDNFIASKQRQILNQKQQKTVAYLNRILETRTEVTLKGLKFEETLTKGDNYERKYYLQSVAAHQGNNDFITDIEVTIKEFRIASVKTTALDTKYAKPYNLQASPQIDQGQAQGQEPPAQSTQKFKNVLQNVSQQGAKNTTKRAFNSFITPPNDFSSDYALSINNVFSFGYKILTGGK